MSENQEPTAVPEVQQPVAAPDFSAQVDLLKAKNQELIGERRNDRKLVEDLQQQLNELQASTQKQKQAKLAENGEYMALWKEASETNSSLQQQLADMQKQLEDKEVQYQQQTIKARAVSAFQQAGVVQSEHMYALLKDKLRLKEGAVVGLDGGVETDLGSYLNNLRGSDSPYAYMFSGTGARGMGAAGSSPTLASGQKSFDQMSFGEKVQMEVENPQLFAQLKACLLYTSPSPRD